MAEFKRITDIVPSAPMFEGERVDITSLLNQDIVIVDFAFLPGRYGEFAVIQANTLDGKTVTFTTGGAAVIRKLKAAEGQTPFLARVVQRKGQSGRRYYDLE